MFMAAHKKKVHIPNELQDMDKAGPKKFVRVGNKKKVEGVSGGN